MIKKFKRADYLALLILAIIIGFQIFTWHFQNQWIPFWDGANYIHTAQDIKANFDNGFLSGIKSLYSERGWRPIIFPNLSSIPLILFNGNIRITVAAVLYIGALITGIYSYKIFRLELSIKSALLGTLCLTSLSWISNYTSLFFAEIFWVAAASATLFYLLSAVKEDSLKNFMFSGISFGLMVCIRPIESIVIALPIVCLLFTYLLIKNKVSKRHLVLYVFHISIISYALSIKILSKNSLFEEFILIIISIIFIFEIFNKNKKNISLFIFLVSAELIALVWHYPSMYKLYSWAYGTSFGELSKTDQRFLGVNFIGITEKLLEHYSLAVLFALLTYSIILILIKLRYKKNISFNFIIILIMAVSTITPIIILLSISGTSDPRRIMISIYLFYIGLIFFILQNNLSYRIKLGSYFFICLITFTQIVGNIGNNFNINNILIISANKLNGSLTKPNISPDGNEVLLEKLTELGIKTGSLGVFTLCTISPKDNCENYNVPWFEPFALSTLAREKALGFSIGTFLDVDYSNLNSVAEQIKSRGFNYAVVDMFNQAIYKNHPIALPTEKLIDIIKLPKLPKGMMLLDCIWMERYICVISIN